MVVRGTEVIEALNTSGVPRTSALPLNPVQSETFPRLSGFAAQFEKFRFKRVQVSYHSGAPATRSGAMGIAVFTEYLPNSSGIPTFLPELGSYQYAAIGSIASNFSAPVWVPRDPEYFFTGDGSNPTVDPLKVYQGSIITVTRDAVTADQDLLAGYLSITYEVEFINMRPTVDKSVVFGSRKLSDPKKQTITSSTDSQVINNGDVINMAGNIHSDRLKDVVNGATAAASIYTDLQAGYEYVVSLTGALGAVGALDGLENKLDDYVSLKQLPLRRVNTVEYKGVPQPPLDEGTYFNPEFCPWLPPELCNESKNIREPMTTGDYNVYLYAVSSSAQYELIAAKGVLTNTGAVGVNWAIPFYLPTTSEDRTEWNVYFQVALAPGDTRVFSLFDSILNIRGQKLD